MVNIVVALHDLKCLYQNDPGMSVLEGLEAKLVKLVLVSSYMQPGDEADGPPLDPLQYIYVSSLPWGPGRGGELPSDSGLAFCTAAGRSSNHNIRRHMRSVSVWHLHALLPLSTGSWVLDCP